GCQVDSELRWHLIQALAASGRVDESRIAEELDTDATETGQRSADIARAAQATGDAKESAWDRFVNDADLSLSTMKELLKHFQLNQHPRDTSRLAVGGGSKQGPILEPFVDRFFKALESYCDKVPTERALAFATYAFPHQSVRPEVIEQTDDFLASGSLPEPVKRVLLEGKDSMSRALKARSADSAA
ncbi:MAG TPA: ERAP1-like C-terminal domain-containing protein, partial [Actinomycetota bacterium]|nr:ERAP1-like C-terminal domain-containing protein [Actinomycetota bacterium]